MDPTLSERLAELNRRIRAAALAAGRETDEIALLAVGKTQPASTIRAAYALGIRRFGENYLQEALTKQERLGDLPIEWHFIGHIQRNKTAAIAHHFQWVESVDRPLVADRLDRARAGLPPLDVLIEVNVSGEESKGGAAPDGVLPLARHIMALPNLRLRGLMALPSPEPRQAAAQFAALRDLFGALKRALPEAPLDTLSMGTSQDYPAAIAAGSNLLRLGTALFGSRDNTKETA